MRITVQHRRRTSRDRLPTDFESQIAGEIAEFGTAGGHLHGEAGPIARQSPGVCGRAESPTAFDRLPPEGGTTHRVPALPHGAPRERAYQDRIKRCGHDHPRHDRVHCEQVWDHVCAGGDGTDQKRESESDPAQRNDRPLKLGQDSSPRHQGGSSGAGRTRWDSLLGACRRHVEVRGRRGTGNVPGHIDDRRTRHCRDYSDRTSHRDRQQGETDRNGLLSIHAADQR